MAGLGDNLSALGGSLFQHGLDIHKQDLLTKLEKEKEERAEQRLKDKEERERNSYGETRPEQLSNGSWVMQDYTKGGQKMGEPKPAPLNIVEELTTQQKANRASLESILLGNTEKEFNVGNLEADRDLEVRDKESQIAYRAGSLANEARRESRLARGALESTVTPPTSMEVASSITKQFDDLTRQARDAGLLQGDIDKLAERAVENGRSLEDSQRRFRDTLNILIRNARQAKEEDE